MKSRSGPVALIVVASIAVACSGGYPDDLDEQLATFSDAHQRRTAILEANGIAAPGIDDRETGDGDTATDSGVDAGDLAAGGGSDDDDLTPEQRALRDGSIVAGALPAVVDLGEDWWTTSFDPVAEIDGIIRSYELINSCDLLVDLTKQSDHRALAGAWYGDQRETSDIQIWNRLFDSATAAGSWFATEASATAMTCVRNLYLVTYEIDENQIEGLVYDDVVFTRGEIGVAIDDDVEVAVFRADTPARIDGEIQYVDSVAEVRILVDRIVIGMRVLTTDAVQTSVLVDTVVPLAVAQARDALAGGASV